MAVTVTIKVIYNYTNTYIYFFNGNIMNIPSALCTRQEFSRTGENMEKFSTEQSCREF